MKPKEIAKAIEDAIIVYGDSLLSFIDDLEAALLKSLLLSLGKLELDDGGYILLTAANRKIIQEAEKVFNDTVLSSSYQRAISDFMGVIDEIDVKNAEYFTELKADFKPNKAFLSSTRKETIKSVESLLLREGVVLQVKLPLMDVISKSINTGAIYSGLTKQLNNFVNGNGNGGVLKNYVRVISTGAAMDYSRSYQQSVATDMDLEFYLYSGDIIRNSRDFCIDKAGNYYHQKEIESWAHESWQGKHKGTTEATIFIYAGGYGCIHSIVPVSINEVPDEVIERAKNEGYI